MAEDDLRWMSATETRERVVRGEFSALDVISDCLARIERLDPLLRAFISLDRAGALEAARQADAALAAGRAPGPLHGVPVAVKDDLWVAGMPATCGSLLFAHFRPSFDGTVAERLRAAGAIIVGKTNMPEFAAWPRTKSWLAGETVNPWDKTRIPGASSGGSSAAVASGMVPVAIGTDGGGSIRIPAALSGVVGLFPSLGRVPAHGSFCCSPTESAGPLARSVADAALVQQVIAGPDARVKHAMTEPAPDVLSGLEAGVRGLRIGWSPDFGWISVDPAIAAAVEAGAAALAGAGASVRRFAERLGHPWGEGRLMAALHEAVAAAGDPPRPAHDPVDPGDAEQWLGEGADAGELCFTRPQFMQLFERCNGLLTPPQRSTGVVRMSDASLPTPEELCAPLERLFAEYDVICSPTLPTVAPVAPAGWASPYADCFMGTNFTFIANVAGLPGASVPCGLVGGLPVGFQILGRRGDEPTVLRVARALEAALPPLPHPPAGAADA